MTLKLRKSISIHPKLRMERVDVRAGASSPESCVQTVERRVS